MTAVEQRLGTMSEKLQKYYKETKARIEVLEMEIQQLPVRNNHDQAFDQRERELQKLSHRIEQLYEYTKSLQRQSEPDPFFTPPPKIFPSFLPSS